MYNSCISSSVGFRVTGSVPIRFNDSCYCFDGGLRLQSCGLCSPFDGSCSSYSSSYCCCCKLCVHRLDLSSSLVYGLRQSSLLQSSVGRRLKYGSGIYSRLNRIDYGFECCDGDARKGLRFEPVEYKGGRKRWAGRGKGRIGGLEFVERREWRRYAGGLSEAEDLIDLLADNVVESTVVSTETKIVWPRKKRVEKKENVCDECSRRKMKSIAFVSSRGETRHGELKKSCITSTGNGREIEKKFAIEKKNKVRTSDGSGSLQRQQKREESTKTHGRRRSEGVNVLSEMNEKLRKEGSGCSLYYSMSSSGDIESDEDIESLNEHENSTYVEAESSKFNKEFRNRNDEESHDFFEETERRRHKQQGIRVEETMASGSYEGNVVGWDRKKSEKQLVETAVDQSKSAAGTAVKRFSESEEAYNSSYKKSDISHKQFKSSQDNTSLISNRREERIRSDKGGSNEISKSGRRYNKESEFEEVLESDAKTNSNKYVQSSVQKDNVSTSTKSTHARKEHREQELVRRSSQQHTGALRIQEFDDTVNVSNLHREKQSTTAQEQREQELVRRSSQQRTGTIRIQEIDDTSEVSNLRQNKQSISAQEQREQELVRRSSQQHTGTIRIQEIDDTSEVSNLLENKQSVSAQKLIEDHRQHNSALTETELRRDLQQIINISEINRSEIQKTSISKKQSDSSIMVGGSSSTSATGQSQVETVLEASCEDRQEIQSRKESRVSLGSLVETSALTSTIDSQVTSRQGVHKSDARVAEEKMEQLSQLKESYKQFEAEREHHRLVQESRLRKEASEEAFKLSYKNRTEKVIAKADDKRTSEPGEILATHQLQSGGTFSKVPAMSYGHEMAPQYDSGDRYRYEHLQQQGQCHSSEFKSHRGGARDTTTYEQPISSEDALGSAERIENSSNVLVEEFLEQAKINLCASEVQEGGLKKTKSENQDSPHSSEGSEAKGPSDEKWDVAQSSDKPSAKVKTPEVSPKAGNTSGKRTGRSLWNVIGNVVRARWIFRGEGQSSPSKSRKRSSSNESASSDAWFSGPEQDELVTKEAEKRSPFDEPFSPFNKEKLEKEHTKSPQAGSDTKLVIDEHSMSGSSLTSGFSGSGFAAQGVSLTFEEAKAPPSGPEMSILANFSTPGLLGTSSSLPSLPSRRLSRSPVVGSKSLRAMDDQTASSSVELIDQQPSPVRLTEASSGPSSSGTEMSFLATYRSPGLLLQSPSLPSRQLGRSPAIGSTSLRAMDDRTASSSVELTDQQPSPVRLTEASEPEEKEREHARRKFQRATQVPRDKFEEWEEALKRETEQNKIDDIFMREALVEAQKAADNWEVPVGAVLVKDGKIVARGCNLVEELRDSTAHAEMICIRDASTALRTWRLSETTLYVTLEPCAMCAGAILQARVTTLVWGAPNKLLGADGSWIRLFPEDGERDNFPDLADKPAAPVHPFHPKMNIRRGVLLEECSQIMQQFFQLRRQKKNKPEPSTPRLPAAPYPAKLITKVHGLFGSSLCL